jgi:hypothetical protein
MRDRAFRTPLAGNAGLIPYNSVMFSFLRRAFEYFLIGFVITFVIYLFVKLDPEEVVLGAAISAAGGVAVASAIIALSRRFPDQGPKEVGQKK